MGNGKRRFAALSLCSVLLIACSEPNDAPESSLDVTDAQPATNDEARLATSQQTATDVDWSATPAADNDMAKFGLTELAVAELTPRSGSSVTGEVQFSPDPATQQMLIEVDLAGLTPNSAHALHVHAVGDCSADDAQSAGGHFAPYDAEHGKPTASQEHHVGDIGNVKADDQGGVEAQFTSGLMAFTGPASVLQKAVVVHARKDDFSEQPAGDAGARIACGVIRT